MGDSGLQGCLLCFVTAVAGVLAEADAYAGLGDVLARALEANERWAQLAASGHEAVDTLPVPADFRFVVTLVAVGCGLRRHPRDHLPSFR